AYGPWGEPSDWTGPRFRYTGQAAFPEAQAYHYKARVYDPALGRFLQTDPIGQADDPNLYAYVKGDPVNETDPSGLAGCGTKIPGRDSANCNSTLVLRMTKNMAMAGRGLTQVPSLISLGRLRERLKHRRSRISTRAKDLKRAKVERSMRLREARGWLWALQSLLAELYFWKRVRSLPLGTVPFA
uniref:RHS repeat-associated core domain-containing protein n=1 Tax=Phenylobacterium sp. TaxID=1871053 RepID=UPI0037C62CB9